MQAGASQEKIAQVATAATSALFSVSETAAIEYAEAMTVTGQRVTDALHGRLRRHFSEAQIVELTAAIALENLRATPPALRLDVQKGGVLRQHRGCERVT